jgi:parallel beta-helix repeat protein
MQAAVDVLTSGFSGGNALVIGPGVFDFVAGVNLTAKKNVRISGAGWSTIIRWKNGNTFANTTPNVNFLFTLGAYSTITDVQLRGQSTFTCPINGVATQSAGGTNTLGGGIFVTDARTWIERVYITQMAEDGIRNTGGIGTKYGEIEIINCGGTGLNITNGVGVGGNYATDGDYSSVWIGACGTGIVMQGGGAWVAGAHVWGCQGDGIFVDTDSFRIVDGYYETNGGWGINVNGRSRGVIKGNDVWANGYTGSQKGGIQLNGTTCINNVVMGNQIRDNRYHGVMLNGAKYNTVQGNIVTDSVSRASSDPGSSNAALTASGTQTTTSTFLDNNAPTWMANANKAIGLTIVITGAGVAGAALTAQVIAWNSTTSVTLSIAQSTATTNATYSLYATGYGFREVGFAQGNSIRGNIVHRNDARLGQVSLINGAFGSESSGNIGWDAASWFEAGNINGAISLDPRNGTIYRGTLTGNVTAITFFPSSGIMRGTEMSISFKQDGTGGRTVSGWPANVKWSSGGAPTFPSAASATGHVRLRYDGSDWTELGRSI